MEVRQRQMQARRSKRLLDVPERKLRKMPMRFEIPHRSFGQSSERVTAAKTCDPLGVAKRS